MPDRPEVQLLSAKWINERIRNVLDQAEEIVDHLLTDGLFSSGYLPFEEHLTEAHVKRMSPDQLIGLLASLPTPDKRLAVLRALDLPLDDIYNLMEGPLGEGALEGEG